MIVINVLLGILIISRPSVRGSYSDIGLLQAAVANFYTIIDLLNNLPPHAARYCKLTLIYQQALYVFTGSVALALQFTL